MNHAASPRQPRSAASMSWRRRLDIAVRTLAAIALGYFLAHAFSALTAAVLPFARPDRVVAGGLLALVVWCVAALYAFAARSSWRAAGVPLALALTMLALAALLANQAVRP
jgi:hypothetical protein